MNAPTTVKFTLKIKGCEEVFAEELGPGVIATKVIEIPPNSMPRSMLDLFIIEQEKKFVEDHIETEMEEVDAT